MKHILLLITVIPILAAGQIQVNYANVPEKEGRYGSYLTKSGQVVSFNDSVTIGMPTGPNGFRHITTARLSADNVISGRTVAIKRIRTFKRKRLRSKVFLEVRPYGLARFLIDYEIALKSSEIEGPSQTE